MDNVKKDTFSDKLMSLVSSEKFYYYYIISIMAVVPVFELITELIGYPFESQSLIIELYGYVGLLGIVMYFMNKKVEKQYYPSDIFYGLLVLFAIIALVCSKNMTASTVGKYYDEKPFHFMTYFALMFAGTMINSDKRRKNVLFVFCGVAALQGIVALFQSFGYRITDCFFDPEWHRDDNLCFGLTQHNNWFAGLSTMFAAAAIGLFIFTPKNKKISYVYLILSALSIYVSIGTSARIAWVGNLMIIVFYIISLIVGTKKGILGSNAKSYFLSFAIIIVVYAVMVMLGSVFHNIFDNAISDFSREIGAGFDEFGTKRGYIWRYGLESVPDNWLTGVGLDNYYYAFTSNPNWHQGMYSQAKGHNEYLHTLVTQGVFAVTNYIALLIYSFFTGVNNVIKTKDDNQRFITWTFLGMLIGYAAQAFFNSSVINVAMYFWIVVGITIPKSTQKPLQFKKRKENNT